MRRNNSLGWFLFGLGQQLQVVASLSMTELFVLIAAPVLFFKERYFMQKNGLITLFWLGFALFPSCIIACIYNHTPSLFAIRGLAVTGLLPCAVVVVSWLYRRDMNGFKWYLLGGVLSMFLSTFIFQHSVETSMLAEGRTGADAVRDIMSGPIYWITRLKPAVTLPARGWYLQCPLVYSMFAPLFMAGFSLLTTISGRSAALSASASALFVFLAGKRVKTIKKFSNRFWIVMAISIVAVFAFHALYRFAATEGILGEEAAKKYEKQTRGDHSIGKLLMGGRMESFCGLIACKDRPIVGFGPWAMDVHGYVAEFLQKYGEQEDYEAYVRTAEIRESTGIFLIPCHSYITMFWLWYGIAGLIFWLYVIFVFIRYLKQDCYAVPQYFMWIAAGIPGFVFNICFSPLSERVGPMVFVTACLMARAVRKGRHTMPLKMIIEIEKVNKK